MVETTVITPTSYRKGYLKACFKACPLLAQLAWRDFVARYKQAILGYFWPVLQPLALMIVLTIVFGYFAGLKNKTNEVPYSLIVLVGILSWQFFATILDSVSLSMISNSSLLKKVYFPRIILCVSATFSSFVDFFISLCIFMGFVLYYDFSLSWRFFMFIPLLFQVYGLGLGLGMIFASLNVYFHDFRHILPVLIRMGFFISPVAYAVSTIAPEFFPYYILNPMAGLISSFRWAFLGTPLYLNAWLISLAWTVTSLCLGALCLISQEKKFADAL